jgi:hypothetical protein
MKLEFFDLKGPEATIMLKTHVYPKSHEQKIVTDFGNPRARRFTKKK